MITSVRAFLDWYDGVNRRTIRDVVLLPAEAEGWTPPVPEDGETGWGFARIVGHVAEARGYFASALLGRGWVWDPWPEDLSAREAWVPALERSAAEFRKTMEGAPDDLLTRRLELIADPGRSMSGWRALTMLAEHEIHHRAQISAYAGLQGWPVAQTFDRTNEWVVAQRDLQIERHRR